MMPDFRSPTEFALDLLGTKFRIIAKGALENNDGRGWQIVDAHQDRGPYPRYPKDLTEWGPDELCDRMIRHWHDVFSTAFVTRTTSPRDEEDRTWIRRNWLSEILYLRNQWAHRRSNYTISAELKLLEVADKFLDDIWQPEEAQLIRAMHDRIQNQIGPNFVDQWPSIEISVRLTSGAAISFSVPGYHDLPFQDFLDKVYFQANLNEISIHEYMYGKQWLLRKPDGKDIQKVGNPDTRLLSSIGLRPGSKLGFVRLA